VREQEPRPGSDLDHDTVLTPLQPIGNNCIIRLEAAARFPVRRPGEGFIAPGAEGDADAASTSAFAGNIAASRPSGARTVPLDG
jgi:hypothetical protein